MRPKAEWAIDSEPMRARGIIVNSYKVERYVLLTKFIQHLFVILTDPILLHNRFLLDRLYCCLERFASP